MRISGTHVDALGSLPIPARPFGEPGEYDLRFAEVAISVRNNGYWTGADGREWFPTTLAFGDRWNVRISKWKRFHVDAPAGTFSNNVGGTFSGPTYANEQGSYEDLLAIEPEKELNVPNRLESGDWTATPIAGGFRITIVNDVSTAEQPITGYQYRLGVTPEDWIDAGSTSQFDILGLSEDELYKIDLRPLNEEVQGPHSEPLWHQIPLAA
ncbi:MAG: hypothetical protein AAGG01_21505 [Planctomycetota bacterium]